MAVPVWHLHAQCDVLKTQPGNSGPWEKVRKLAKQLVSRNTRDYEFNNLPHTLLIATLIARTDGDLDESSSLGMQSEGSWKGQ